MVLVCSLKPQISCRMTHVLLLLWIKVRNSASGSAEVVSKRVAELFTERVCGVTCTRSRLNSDWLACLSTISMLLLIGELDVYVK